MIKEKAVEQAREQHFSSTSDYLQHLIRTDAEVAEEKKKFEVFLQAGLASGEARNMTLEELSDFMKNVLSKA